MPVEQYRQVSILGEESVPLSSSLMGRLQPLTSALRMVGSMRSMLPTPPGIILLSPSGCQMALRPCPEHSLRWYVRRFGCRNSAQRRHFDQTILLLCVKGYITYKLSYRELVAMIAEQGSTSHPPPSCAGSSAMSRG